MLVTKVNCPANKMSIKCPYNMTPEEITVHNTANDASAMSEISYMLGNNYETSFHFAVDDYRAVQGLELNRNGWHAGDGGSGRGNRKTIGIEICYSKSGGERFVKAEQNAAELVANLLKQYGWGIDRVKKHQDWSGKYCPHRTLDMGWARFIEMVKSHLNGSTEETTPEAPTTSLNFKEGDVVTINGVYTSSTSTTKLVPAVTTGTITKVLEGTRNPYLLNSGNIGWTNDSCIVTKPEPTPAPKPVTTKFEKGDIVTINGVYTSSTSTEKLKPLVSKGTITDIKEGARNPYLLNNGQIGWVNDDCIVSMNVPEPTATYKTISNCTWLNLRTSAGYGSNVYRAVKAGTRVEYLGVENGWAKIKYNGKTLYCGTGYLK